MHPCIVSVVALPCCVRCSVCVRLCAVAVSYLVSKGMDACAVVLGALMSLLVYRRRLRVSHPFSSRCSLCQISRDVDVAVEAPAGSVVSERGMPCGVNVYTTPFGVREGGTLLALPRLFAWSSSPPPPLHTPSHTLSLWDTYVHAHTRHPRAPRSSINHVPHHYTQSLVPALADGLFLVGCAYSESHTRLLFFCKRCPPPSEPPSPHT